MEFDVTIEIPKGQRNKYEMDHATGRIRLDRMLFALTRYPDDHGFIDGTLWCRPKSLLLWPRSLPTLRIRGVWAEVRQAVLGGQEVSDMGNLSSDYFNKLTDSCFREQKATRVGVTTRDEEAGSPNSTPACSSCRTTMTLRCSRCPAASGTPQASRASASRSWTSMRDSSFGAPLQLRPRVRGRVLHVQDDPRPGGLEGEGGRFPERVLPGAAEGERFGGRAAIFHLVGPREVR